MIVPRLTIAVVDLRHPHAPLGQPAGGQAGAGELAVTVELAGLFALAADVERLLRLALHAVCHLECLDAGFELGVAAAAVAVQAVELPHQVELLPLVARGDLRVGDVANHLLGIEIGVVDVHSLEDAGEEAVAPELRPDHRLAGAEHHEAGQVLVVGPQSVREPRPHRGACRLRLARVHHQQRGFVVRQVGVHRPDDTQLVDLLRDVRKQLAHVDARFAVFLELEGGPHQLPLGAAHGVDQLLGGFLTGVFLERRLGVERVDLGRTAIHEEMDDPFRLRREVRGAGGQRRGGGTGGGGGCLGSPGLFGQGGGEPDHPQATSQAGDRITTGQARPASSGKDVHASVRPGRAEAQGLCGSQRSAGESFQTGGLRERRLAARQNSSPQEQLGQSTNVNSFEPSSTWAYCSQRERPLAAGAAPSAAAAGAGACRNASPRVTSSSSAGRLKSSQ